MEKSHILKLLLVVFINFIEVIWTYELGLW